MHRYVTLLVCVCLILALTASAVAAPRLYKETWSVDGSTSGWYAQDAGTISHDDANDWLSWTVADGSGWMRITGDGAASGGAYQGDLASLNPSAFELDFARDSGTMDELRFMMIGGDHTTGWMYYLTPPTVGGGEQHYVCPLTSSAGWTMSGVDSFSNVLGRVQHVELEFRDTSGTWSGTGHLDNFDLVPQRGDANRDGLVNDADLSLLLTYWPDGNNPTTWERGDFDGDQDTGDSDLSWLLTNWSSSSATGAPVPEPATLTLLALGACLPLLRKRR